MNSHRVSRRLQAVIAGAVLLVPTGCSRSTPTESPRATTAYAVTPVAVGTAGCTRNPATAPVPKPDGFRWVPKTDQISVTMSGIPSGRVQPGAAPTEVEVTLCNDSPVDYPSVGVVVVLDHCDCASGGPQITVGTVEFMDPLTGVWIQLPHPSAGTGMDYLLTATNNQALPRGAVVTLRYRLALDRSMDHVRGSGVSATAVMPDGPNPIGGAGLSFTVSG
jgi:hypothetical protein